MQKILKNIPLAEVKTNSGYSLHEAIYYKGYQLISEVPLHQSVEVYSALISRNHTLVNRGDYVGYTNKAGEVC